ncbi:histone deacetylase [bacterium]|nr:histone deacetylase [bacterium]
MATGFVYHAAYQSHEAQGYHPENPDRLRHILQRLEESSLVQELKMITPLEAEISLIQLIHTPEHIRRIQKASSGHAFLDADTYVNSFSYSASLTACGGAIAAVDAVMQRQVKNVFCAVRPPGHHAESNRAMGFCLFNNVALAARYAQKQYNIGKVLIVDWDVHHGNGTQEIFWTDPTVMYISLHQWPLYPGTGRKNEIGGGEGKGLTLNFPMSAGSTDSEYLRLFNIEIRDAVEKFQPELILISAGFDAHEKDPLAQMKVTTQGFAEMSTMIKELARSVCSSRIISVLEGGYHLQALAESVEAHIRVLADV